jgi:multidrug efflux pump subunit AcrA (membrane-fusion protein)
MKHYGSKDFASGGSASASAHSAERSFRLWPRVLGGLALVVLLVFGCGGWAAIAKLEGAVVATGTVKVDQNLKEVQHRDGGIVKTLAVRQGDLVKEGQVLATLDDVQRRSFSSYARSWARPWAARRA